jgi:hypothetical protein
LGFGEKIRAAGLVPSFGTIGDGLDNAITQGGSELLSA